MRTPTETDIVLRTMKLVIYQKKKEKYLSVDNESRSATSARLSNQTN